MMAKRFCSKPGCPELVEIGARFCERHQREQQQAQDRRRGSSWKRGYDSDWRRLRDWKLRENPLCEECARQGRTAAADEVDHIKPFYGKDDPLRLDPDNLQSLCSLCHKRKTAREDGGYGLPRGGVPDITGSV